MTEVYETWFERFIMSRWGVLAAVPAAFAITAMVLSIGLVVDWLLGGW